MASLQLIKKGWQTGYRLRVCAGGKRHSVWLGPLREREAMTVKLQVEAVIDSQKLRTPLPTETQRWLAQIPAELRGRLREVLGVSKTVDEAVELYVVHVEATHKPSTARAAADTLEQFASHFGSLQLRSLTAVQIDSWLAKQNVCESTVGKHVKHLRTWLAWCRDPAQGYCDSELSITTPATIGVGAKEFVDLKEFERVINYFTDPEMEPSWR